MTPPTLPQLMAEWQVTYDTRLGHLCEDRPPSPEQEALARAEADEAVRAMAGAGVLARVVCDLLAADGLRPAPIETPIAMNDANNWTPPEGSTNPMRMINGQWFNITNAMEKPCLDRGRHRWGPDRYADEDQTKGFHKCRDCYRTEFL